MKVQGLSRPLDFVFNLRRSEVVENQEKLKTESKNVGELLGPTGTPSEPVKAVCEESVKP